MLSEGAEIFFAADEFGFGAFAVHPLLGFLHGAADSRSKAFEFIFQHVIRRATAEAFDRSVFADGSRNQDEGSVGIFFPDGVQGLEAIASGSE